MEQYYEIISTIALSMGVAWASGINLYATLLMLGVLGSTGQMVLPPKLEILMHPLVMGAAGFMYLIEFLTDKWPGFDNFLDLFHFFIFIPAGALLAAGAVGEVNPPLLIAAAIIGGTITAGTHTAKSGARLVSTANPDPVTNVASSIGASVAKDVSVFAGMWTAISHPFLFIILLIIFIVLVILIIPLIWKGLKLIVPRILKGIGTFFDRILNLIGRRRRIDPYEGGNDQSSRSDIFDPYA